MKLNPEDLEITIYNPGNRYPYPGIRIKHLPTGITVESINERSQYHNSQKCIEMLTKELEES